MHFTVDQSAEIDSQVEADLSLIAESVRKAAGKDNMASLFLVGGFGRGEGGVVRKKGRFLPANDYDLELVTLRPVQGGLLKKLGEDLAGEIGVPWVHIESHTLSQLPRMKFTMYNFDLKYASFPVEGEGEVLERIPDMDPARMPWREAENIMFTRLWSFIGPIEPDMFEREPGEEESFFLAGQVSKALLAIQDAMLIPRGLYHSSYVKRLENLLGTGISPEDRPLFEWATDFKLHPGKTGIKGMMERLFHVKKLFLETLFSLYSTVYGRSFAGWDDYARIHFTNSYTRLKRIYFFLVKRSSWFIDYLNYNMGSIYLVNALEREKIATGQLKKADFYFRRIPGYTLPESLEWNALRNQALKLREEIWH